MLFVGGEHNRKNEQNRQKQNDKGNRGEALIGISHLWTRSLHKSQHGKFKN